MKFQSAAAMIVAGVGIAIAPARAAYPLHNTTYVYSPKPPRWNFYAEGRYEYDSNVLQLPESGANEQTNQADSSGSGIAYGEYRPERVEGSHLRILGIYQGYRKLHEFDLMGWSAGAQQDLALFRPTRVRYDVQFFWLARDPYLLTHTAGLESDILPEADWKLTAAYQIGFKKFVSVRYSSFNGIRHQATLTLEHPSRLLSGQVKAQAMGVQEHPRNDAFKYSEADGLLSLTWNLPLQVQLKLQSEGSVFWYAPLGTAALPYRRDVLQTYAGEVSRLLGNHLMLSAGYSRIFSRSTAPNFTYRKYLVDFSLGIVF